MHAELLVDAVVREMTRLVARLATAGGLRAPLMRVERQVFLGLVDELSRAGVSRKVGADMFGLPLRSYLRKIRRLAGSETTPSRSLWEAVLEHVSQHEHVSRASLYEKFGGNDPDLLAGVLRDLCESGLVIRCGEGNATTYRPPTAEELAELGWSDSHEGLDSVIWALIYRLGPLCRTELEELVRTPHLEQSLDRLLTLGRVELLQDPENPRYLAKEFAVAAEASHGWEAAVFDHIEAVIRTVTARLKPGDEPPTGTGGSTYSLEVWPGHPMEADVLGQLNRFRQSASELRQRVRQYNEAHEKPEQTYRVTFYGGQLVVPSTGPEEPES